MTSSRYSIVGPWSTESVRGDAAHTVDVITESATLRDTRTGTEYREGAWRVRIYPPRPDIARAKTFRGESAWSDAERYAHDAVTAINFGR